MGGDIEGIPHCLSHHRDDEENVALAVKGKKKKKFKKGSKDGAKHHDGEKKDMSKVKFFACQKFGHYAGQCPNKKKKKQQTTTSTEIDEFAARFEGNFSLCWCLCRESIIHHQLGH